MKAWSRMHSECRGCGTTDRPHQGHGYCERCYYHEVVLATKGEAFLAGRKQYRLANADRIEETQKRWEKRSAPHRRKYKTAWRQKNVAKWPKGAKVAVSLWGFEPVGVIESVRPGKPWTADIRMPLGTLIPRVPVTDLRRIS